MNVCLALKTPTISNLVGVFLLDRVVERYDQLKYYMLGWATVYDRVAGYMIGRPAVMIGWPDI